MSTSPPWPPTSATCTYWYLTAVPDLMAATARRFERYADHGGLR